MIEKEFVPKIHELVQKFYEIHHVDGIYLLTFGIRAVADSDGNSVIDAYLLPMSDINSMPERRPDGFYHIQLLSDTELANMTGYEFVVSIKTIDSSQNEFELMIHSGQLKDPGKKDITDLVDVLPAKQVANMQS